MHCSPVKQTANGLELSTVCSEKFEVMGKARDIFLTRWFIR